MEEVKFKLYPNEHYNQQEEKHKAYLKTGYKLVSQKQGKDGLIKREYQKKKKSN